MLIDTHCHLDAAEFDPDRDEVLLRALAAGVGRIVVPTVNALGFDPVRALSETRPVVAPAYGIHPLCAATARPEDELSQLEAGLRQGRAVAVGEIGLDYFVAERDEKIQIDLFVEQLKLARRFDLPVILHVRRAIDPVLRELRRHPVSGGIAHAFNGSRQQAEAFIGLGFCLGFGGALTWERARRIRSLAASLPAESIVLETDAPDIPPAWIGRGRNEPGELKKIANVMAGLRGINVETLGEITSHNARRVLPGLSGDAKA